MPAKKLSTRIQPMKSSGTQHFIERTYREGGSFQWVRETFINALEAEATRVAYGIEWQAVESQGVYRRIIADNGKGMTPDQLVEFFNTFGGGGKPIGGVAENFGVGSKTSLLPWNGHGVVVVSWVDGIPAMVWLQRDADTGEYGLRYLDAVDEAGESSVETVVRPFDDHEHGCDWSLVRPDWIKEHGTVVILLGNSPSEDTALGDPSRVEAKVHGVVRYLNHRIWEIPNGVEVSVESFQSDTKAKWPRSLEESRSTGSRSSLRRVVLGAKHWIEYPEARDGGGLEDSGTVPLDDGTKADWFLWKGDRPQVHGYAPETGFVAALYRNELYNFQAAHSIYRSLGVSASTVRQRLWVVFRPPEFDDSTRRGVFPTTDRNALKLRGGPNAGDDLPISDWANEFADKMPQAVRNALAEARTSDTRTIDDEAWRERLMERFGSRWKMTRLVAQQTGQASIRPVQGAAPGSRASAPSAEQRSGGAVTVGGEKTGPDRIGSAPGPVPARPTRVGGGLPHCRAVKAEDIGGKGILAAWQRHDPEFPSGVVLLNVEHPVLLQQIAHYQSQYPDHLMDEVEEKVLTVYKEVAVAKIAHSEYLRSVLSANEIEELRSPHSLTMALLGLITEDALLQPRLGGKLGKTRLSA